MKKLFLVLVVLPSLMSAAPFQASPQTPTLLAQAQQAYLEKDYNKTVMSLKQAYMQATNNSVVQKNVMQMFRQLQKMKPQSQIDVGWTLPPEISELRVAVARRLDDGVVRNKLVISGEIASVDEIMGFQVVRYPDTVVFDKQKKIGNFEDNLENDEPMFYYTTRTSPFTVTSGLYMLKVSTKSGSNIDGWFVLTDEDNSTANPQFIGFDGTPTFDTGYPQIQWQDFISPQYNPQLDYRMLGIWVGKQNEDNGVWNYWSSDMTQRTATLGSPVTPDHGWTKGPLANGDYYVLLSFAESHRFGPIRIARRSETVRYFSVKK